MRHTKVLTPSLRELLVLFLVDLGGTSRIIYFPLPKYDLQFIIVHYLEKLKTTYLIKIFWKVIWWYY
jgi:hypothetical protein